MNKTLWQQCIDFHGHVCPGLAIGFRAALAALEYMDLKAAADEEVVCVAENDACGLDAVQVLTGCTLGKGNLRLRIRSKQAFTFFDREKGLGIRFLLKPLPQDLESEERLEHLLSTPWPELFTVHPSPYPLPEKASIYDSVLCEKCGESTGERHIRLQEGQLLCLDCWN